MENRLISIKDSEENMKLKIIYFELKKWK